MGDEPIYNGAAGKPTVGMDMAVVDDEGRELAPGEFGQIIARSVVFVCTVKSRLIVLLNQLDQSDFRIPMGTGAQFTTFQVAPPTWVLPHDIPK